MEVIGVTPTGTPVQDVSSIRLRYIVCSLIIHELLLLFVSSTTLIFMNYAPNMKV